MDMEIFVKKCYFRQTSLKKPLFWAIFGQKIDEQREPEELYRLKEAYNSAN